MVFSSLIHDLYKATTKKIDNELCNLEILQVITHFLFPGDNCVFPYLFLFSGKQLIRSVPHYI